MPTIKKPPRDPAQTTENPIRERIIGAAFESFLEQGYAGTSMLEIATRAKVSKRDLYANFANKQAVLLACIASRASRMRLPADLPVPHNRRMLATTLTVLGATVLREVSRPEVLAMFRLAIAEAEHSPDVAATLEASRTVNRGALAALLAKAQAGGILGAGDPGEMMEQYFALLWGDLFLRRLLGVAKPPKPAEIDRRARIATDAFLTLRADPEGNERQSVLQSN